MRAITYSISFALLVALSGCATARHLSAIEVGMTEDEVRQNLGRPKGVGSNQAGEYLIYNYANHGALPLSGGRTNYYVQFKDGKVTGYGPLSTLSDK